MADLMDFTAPKLLGPLKGGVDKKGDPSRKDTANL